MATLHFSLNNLPPHLRAQAERQLGVSSGEATVPPVSRAFAIPNSTPPRASQKAPRRSGGVFRANSLFASKNATEALPAPSPEGFKSIVEAKAERKAANRRQYLTPDMAKGLVKECTVSPDGDEVKIILGCSPYMIPTAQQKKIAVIGGHPRIYKQAKVQKAEKTITLAMQPLAKYFEGWTGHPIGVYMDFCYEYPKDTPKKDLVDFLYSVHKNDLDNSEKGISDALTAAGFWEDDNQIAELHLRKFRVVTEPRIVLTIRKLPTVLSEYDLFWEF